jgi:bifunctional DNA-binding transcriptional regulator/antitoxin component of YhaV-PrlF toxin-antitoxin module
MARIQGRHGTDLRARYPRDGGSPRAHRCPPFLSGGGYLVRRPLVPSIVVRMEAIQQYLVSASGQMSVPAAVRHRWHLDNGGPVDVIDLGFGVLTVPAGQAQRLLGDLLSREDHAAFVQSLIDDPDLATS